MSTTLGWCQSAAGTRPDAYHDLCPGHVVTQVGVRLDCDCAAHVTDPTTEETPHE